MSRYFVGMTGASGHVFAQRLIRALVECGHDVDLALTGAGHKVLAHELGVRCKNEADLAAWLGADVARNLRLFGNSQVEAPAASGTSGTKAAILIPCSMGTLARVSVGFSSNLVERVADVAVKERRTLVLVPRETPLSQIHLENMLRMTQLGATVLPAMPGWYHKPRTMDDLVDHVVGKILDRLGLEHTVGARWSGTSEPEEEPGIQPHED